MRKARERSFSSELFDEHGWNILLHLFIALASNETVSERELARRAGCPGQVGQSWLTHLVAAGLIVTHEEGGNVEMTMEAARGMRTFLDDAAEIRATMAGS